VIAVCVGCGEGFAFDAGFYESRGLHPPARCRRCRAERAAKLVPQAGEVVKVASNYIIIRSMTGRFIAFDTGPFLVRERVSFGVDEDAPVRPGDLPLARRVTRLP
jgi:hypothetical protein